MKVYVRYGGENRTPCELEQAILSGVMTANDKHLYFATYAGDHDTITTYIGCPHKCTMCKARGIPGGVAKKLWMAQRRMLEYFMSGKTMHCRSDDNATESATLMLGDRVEMSHPERDDTGTIARLWIVKADASIGFKTVIRGSE
jgi:hypothetical protein